MLVLAMGLMAGIGCRTLVSDAPETAQELKRRLISNAEAGNVIASWAYPWDATSPKWRTGEPDFASKINGLCGRVPMLYFTDFRFFAGNMDLEKKNLENRASMVGMVKAVYAKYGSVPVFSWHPMNPYMPKKVIYHKGKYLAPYRYRYSIPDYPQEHRYVIHEILTGTGAPCAGFANPKAWYDAQLESIAELLKGLKDAKGRPIPAIVRLFHECEDDWQWWGRGSVSIEEYITMFRYTVKTLRERTAGEAELLFAYCPDLRWKELGEVGSGDGFLARYPGDEWVDVIGFDDYSIGKEKKPGIEALLEETIRKLRLVSDEARRRNLASGIFETGVVGAVLGAKGSKDETYYTYLRRAVLADGVHIGFANTWVDAWTIPVTDAGRAAWREYLADPRILSLPK